MNVDRGVARSHVERAEAAGYRAIVVTVDVPGDGHRPRDLRNAFEAPGTFGNFPDDHVYNAPFGELLGGLMDPSLTWADIDEIRGWTSLPVVVKGLLSPEDARIAIDRGVAGIWVSNHGGRQLDRAIASLDALGPDRRRRRRPRRGLPRQWRPRRRRRGHGAGDRRPRRLPRPAVPVRAGHRRRTRPAGGRLVPGDRDEPGDGAARHRRRSRTSGATTSRAARGARADWPDLRLAGAPRAGRRDGPRDRQAVGRRQGLVRDDLRRAARRRSTTPSRRMSPCPNPIGISST